MNSHVYSLKFHCSKFDFVVELVRMFLGMSVNLLIHIIICNQINNMLHFSFSDCTKYNKLGTDLEFKVSQ